MTPVTSLAERFEQLRPLMFSIAYRMVGSAAEAEDIVQEAFLRMHRDSADPVAPDAYAATVTTRLAIDHLRSARVRREEYPGTWLPEPLLTDDPNLKVELAESASMAFLLVLERLSPVERAVFLLREVFGYEYELIAPIVDQTPQTCRQTLVRARAHVRADSPRFEVAQPHSDELARRFFAACAGGDLAELEQILADDVVFYADGGGKRPATPRPVAGRDQVARLLLGLFRYAATHGLRLQPREVNGEPGAQVYGEDDTLQAVFALHVVGGQIASIHNVLNPDKLRHLA